MFRRIASTDWFNRAAPVSSPTDVKQWRRNVALVSSFTVLLLTIANLVFNLTASARGYGFPFSTFLWKPEDNFGDFFSLLSTYPGGERAWPSTREGLYSILPTHPLSLTVTGPAAAVTHFHMTPFSTLLSLGAVAALRIVDPVVLFLALLLALLTWWILLVRRRSVSLGETIAWACLGAISYPTLFMVTRGNLHAGLTAMLAIHALLLGLQRRNPLFAALLLAAAVNIRPNAILLALPLIAFYWPRKWLFMSGLALSGLTILLSSLLISNMAYPAYNLNTFVGGLKTYSEIYLVGDWGLQYGSSLFGAFRAVFEVYHPLIVSAASLIALAIIAGGLAAWHQKRLDDALLIFLSLAGYCLGSAVFGDYHLMIFLVVPLALAAQPPTSVDWSSTRVWPIVLGCTCFVLAPKNYIFQGSSGRPTSAQVVLNPALLLAASIIVIGAAFLINRSGPGLRRARAP